MKTVLTSGYGALKMADEFEAVHARNLFEEGFALHRQGQLTQAQALYRRVLKLQPKHAEALHLLGVIAAQSKDYGQAVDLIGRALEINPTAIAYANLGNAQNDLGQYRSAVESYDKAIAINPNYANVHSNRGKALHELKQYQSALESYNRAIAINPNDAEAFSNRGVALYFLRQFQAALESYDKAIAINPDNAETHFNRGIALHELMQNQAAIESYDRSLAIKPGSAKTWSNRGNVLRDLKRFSDAISSYDMALSLKPDFEIIYGERLHTMVKICDWRKNSDLVNEITSKVRLGKVATQPFDFLAINAAADLQRKAAEIWINQMPPAGPELGDIPRQPKERKIRVGYYSADFHNHATAYLMAELFEQRDKSRFEIVAFSFGPDANDQMRGRIVAAFDEFVDVRNQTDKDIARLSRSLSIDIAVDLKGFTQDGRAGIFAYRAAPVQVSYLGYPGTMGANFIDYLIADQTLIPEVSQAYYTEKIAYLPNSYQVNDTRRKVSDREFTRKELDLPESDFVFCCFNSNYKITPPTFDSWMAILTRVPGSVLWLLEDNVAASSNLRMEAQKRGVDPKRLVFAARMPLPEHLSRHRAADLFLDTLPCNAHTTASDALWAGLPVLTRCGQAFASRVAASLLTAIGLPELITTTQGDYEKLAIQLATDPENLSAVRQKLARNRLTTPLFDTVLFTRHIEEAYTRMHGRFHAHLPPDHIHIGRKAFMKSSGNRFPDEVHSTG